MLKNTDAEVRQLRKILTSMDDRDLIFLARICLISLKDKGLKEEVADAFDALTIIQNGVMAKFKSQSRPVA